MKNGNASYGRMKSSPCGKLFITDFDGTLLRSDNTFSEQDLDALATLKNRGVTTAVATGRSYYSFINSPGANLSVDYIIFSTGAGVARHPHGNIIRKTNLPAMDVAHGLEFFIQSDFDFMLHCPVPDNHLFLYRSTGRKNPDFEARIANYRQFATPLHLKNANGFGEAAQFLTVVPREETLTALKTVKEGLPEFSMIHATSPLDHISTWIELFHPRVSKSQAAAWLAAKLNIAQINTLAIGNDYNDLDLLEWSGVGFVVANAPEALKGRFENVSSHNSSGVADAVAKWLN
jgi:Cof subfamily protein (haloacid dehalogenase superfamily)